MKILTICRAGAVRSMALAIYLKQVKQMFDVIPIGIEEASEETRQMLYLWADRILVVEEQFMSRIPQEYQHKTKYFPIGADIYGNPCNENLKALINKIFGDGFEL
jgi:hypothetical protein